MSLTTFSCFYYNFDVTSESQYLDFDEGAGQLTAVVERGSFTPTEIATKIKIAMDEIGTQVYTVVFNRPTRTFTISATNPFDLLPVTGTSGGKVFPVIGYVIDTFNQTSHEGRAAGNIYEPQFILQDHISSDNYQSLIKPSVNISSSGKVEVVRFGVEKFVQCNLKFISNKMLMGDGNIIKSRPNGVELAQDFLRFITTKKKIEYMPNINDRNIFQTVMLESTDAEKDGTGYILKELYDKGLPDIFESGKLVFRVIE